MTSRSESPVKSDPDRRQVLTSSLALTALSVAIPFDHGHAQQRPAPLTAAPAAAPIVIGARPISSFSRTMAAQQQFGRLTFRGGLVLTSEVPDFGGWSGLVLDEAGRLLMISDRGSWLTGTLLYEGTRPKGIGNAVLGSILGVGRRPLNRGRDRDSESVTLLDGNLTRGSVLIAFERNHRIGRFAVHERGIDAPSGYLKMPPEVRSIPVNKSFEAVSLIRGGAAKGSIIAFCEEFHDAKRNHTGWIWAGGMTGQPQRIGLTNIGDFAITDVASLSDGSLIVLERKFRWLEGVRMRLRQISASAVQPGATLDGEILIEADMGYDIDNMEGLSIHRDQRGATVLTLISDDNFNQFLQRSILLQFTLG